MGAKIRLFADEILEFQRIFNNFVSVALHQESGASFSVLPGASTPVVSSSLAGQDERAQTPFYPHQGLFEKAKSRIQQLWGASREYGRSVWFFSTRILWETHGDGELADIWGVHLLSPEAGWNSDRISFFWGTTGRKSGRIPENWKFSSTVRLYASFGTDRSGQTAAIQCVIKHLNI